MKLFGYNWDWCILKSSFVQSICIVVHTCILYLGLWNYLSYRFNYMLHILKGYCFRCMPCWYLLYVSPCILKLLNRIHSPVYKFNSNLVDGYFKENLDVSYHVYFAVMSW